jgi:hypothetical protein
LSQREAAEIVHMFVAGAACGSGDFAKTPAGSTDLCMCAQAVAGELPDPAKMSGYREIEMRLDARLHSCSCFVLKESEYEEGVMKALICAAMLSLMGISTTFAQAPSAPAKMSADEKKAISKACSDQANQKGLHGKDRTKFRAVCIKNGGKPQ